MTRALRDAARAAIMLAACALVALACVAPRTALAYNDTSSGEWYATEGWLGYVTTNGIMTGYSDGSGNFGPWDQITRGQVATVLYRMANPGSDATTNPSKYGTKTSFKDVPKGAYYTAAIEWCYKQGIITGDKNGSTWLGTFRPDDPVMRGELATMAYRYAAHMGADTSCDASAFYATMDNDLLDAGTPYEYARTALTWTCDKGVLGGVWDGGGRWLDITSDATRAEASKVFTVLDRDVVKRAGSYTVSFVSNGGSAVKAQTLTSGQKASRAWPTRSGYTFRGWFTDKALTREYGFDSCVTGNVTLYAKWEATAAAHDDAGASQAADALGVSVTEPATSAGVADSLADGEVSAPGASARADAAPLPGAGAPAEGETPGTSDEGGQDAAPGEGDAPAADAPADAPAGGGASADADADASADADADAAGSAAQDAPADEADAAEAGQVQAA